uniref:FAD-binding FR-type domain-containing protein n=1 Tax=Ganoderma boninense TaxID=34458 RepID=A0A5K1K0A5_9APHY|nr:FAD-binding FR-type domain-containing protein [Ganoderma boninense]
MTVDPKAIQHVFQKSGYNYTKKTSQNFMGYLIAGPGIATMLGEDHHRHRKIMHPAFSAPQLRSFLPLFQRIAGKLSEKWKGELVTTGELELMMNKWLSRATLDVIGEAAFDYDYNALDAGGRSALSKAYDNLLKDIDYQPSNASILFRSAWDYIPIPLLKLIKYVPAHPFTRVRNLNNLFMQYGKQILREQAPEVDAERKVNGKDVMSILIKANSSADAKTRLDDAELIAEMATLTIAGHETTASTLSAARGKVMERGGTEFTTEDLDSLTLTMNAIKETLRLHPIAYGLPRVAVKDDVIPLAYPIVSTTGETISEIPIKAGQVVYSSFAGYQRLPGVWGEDADEWNPDRFLRIEMAKQPVSIGVLHSADLERTIAPVLSCWDPGVHRLAVLVRTPVPTIIARVLGTDMHADTEAWLAYLPRSLIEMQAFLGELLEAFQFHLPREKMEVQKATVGVGMAPIVRGKPELGAALPLRISLVQ